jgi:hypothetical protein
MSGSKLADMKLETLKEIYPVLKSKYPAACITNPAGLSDETERLRLAEIAGSHRVVLDIGEAIKQREKA